MARSIYVNGEALVLVKGPAGSIISSLAELGLAQDQARITLHPRHRDIQIDAWGGEVPMDSQRKLAYATISLNLLHFDMVVVEELARLAMGGTAFGRVGRAGLLMGGGLPRFAPGNFYVGLNITSPIANNPWRFPYAHLIDPIGDFALGTERTTLPVVFRAIPYTIDPWNGGIGATDAILYDGVLDT